MQNQNPNKPRTHTDVQWIISSLSLAATLGLWGLFASSEKQGAGVSSQVTFQDPPTQQQVVITQQPPMLQPGQVLLLGGNVPQPTQSTVTTTITTSSRGGGGGGGGGGKPSGKTHSSHP